MSPAALSPEPSFDVHPYVKTKSQKFDFGAVVHGVDLNDISDSDVKKLREAAWTHKVIVIKGQGKLHPTKHWELVTRLDPEAQQMHSHGDMKSFNKKGGFLSKSRDVFGIPGAENVRLIGKGYQGEDHYGIKDQTIKGLTNDFHADLQDEKDFDSGITRFQRWHIDAPLYDRDPAWFTTLRAVKLPSGPDVTIAWDDGSGMSMQSPPGLTAFFSTSQLYRMLTAEEQALADHSWVEYAPHPYLWIEHCKANSTGLGLKNQGKEHTIEELGDYDAAKVKTYPMVWVNPVTGEKAFQVHGICVRKMFLRSGPDEEPRVVEDVAEIRKFLAGFQSRILRPEYIWLPQVEEGDMLMWDNYGLFHSAVDYPLEKYSPRSMHQANVPASKGPQGPVPIPMAA